MPDVPNRRRDLLLRCLDELRAVVALSNAAPARDLHHYEWAAHELERLAAGGFASENELIAALERILSELRSRTCPPSSSRLS